MKLTKQTTIAEILQIDTFKGFLQNQLDIYKMYGANIDARAKTLRELVEAPWYNVAGITEQYDRNVWIKFASEHQEEYIYKYFLSS